MPYLRRLWLATIGAAVGIPLACSAIASGEPQEWDIERFDDCIKTYVTSDDPLGIS